MKIGGYYMRTGNESPGRRWTFICKVIREAKDENIPIISLDYSGIIDDWRYLTLDDKLNFTKISKKHAKFIGKLYGKENIF